MNLNHTFNVGLCCLVVSIGLYRENAIAIESEARYPFGGISTTNLDACVCVCVFAKFDKFLPVRSHFDTKRPVNFFHTATFHPLPLDRFLRSIVLCLFYEKQ